MAKVTKPLRTFSIANTFLAAVIQLYWIHKRTKGNFKETKTNICITSFVIHNKIDSEPEVSGSRVVAVLLIDCKTMHVVVYIFHTHTSLATYTKGKCQVNCTEHKHYHGTTVSKPVVYWKVVCEMIINPWIIQITMDMQNGRNIMSQNKDSIIFVCFCGRKDPWR